MKHLAAVPVFLATLSLTSIAQDEPAPAGGSSFLMVKTSDHAKEQTVKVMSSQEYKELCASINAENKAWDKALAAAEKEWKANPETAKKSFPRNAIAQRKATVSQQYSSQDKAIAALDAYDKRAASQAEADKKKAADKSKNKTKNANVKSQANKQKADEQRNTFLETARTLFETKLGEIVTPQGGGDNAAAQEEKPADKNQKK